MQSVDGFPFVCRYLRSGSPPRPQRIHTMSSKPPHSIRIYSTFFLCISYFIFATKRLSVSVLVFHVAKEICATAAAMCCNRPANNMCQLMLSHCFGNRKFTFKMIFVLHINVFVDATRYTQRTKMAMKIKKETSQNRDRSDDVYDSALATLAFTRKFKWSVGATVPLL